MYLTHIINSPSKTLVSFFLLIFSDQHHTLREYRLLCQYAWSLLPPKHTKSHPTYAYQTYFSTHHESIVFLQNFFHLAEHTHKYSSSRPLQKPKQLHLSITNLTHFYSQFLTHHWIHHNSHTTNLSPFPNHHNLSLLPSITNNLGPCPLHLTSQKQHTSFILLLGLPKTSPIPTKLHILHVSTSTSKHQLDFQFKLQ